jgi:putative drug exporter of the RND superfamily
VAAGGFARVLRRLRWPVALLWIAGIAALVPAANGLARATDDTALAYLPSSSQSELVTAVQQEAERASGAPVSEQAIVVFARPGGLTRRAR